MATTTYRRRKAEGLCVACARPSRPQRIYCQECHTDSVARNRRHRYGLELTHEGPLVWCCQAWVIWPGRCTRCGRAWGRENPAAGPREAGGA